MDHARFEAFARRLGRQASRRGVFGAAVAGLFASIAITDAKRHVDAELQASGMHRMKGGVSPQGPCGNGGVKANKCKKDKQCCTSFCHKGNCRCKKTGDECAGDVECCSDTTDNSCLQGICQSASSCAGTCDGCCAGENCVAIADETAQQCGAGGAACAACDKGETCRNGDCATPTCAETCEGCCDGETCVAIADQTDQECGTGGAACAPCTGSDTCKNGVCACPMPVCPTVTASTSKGI